MKSSTYKLVALLGLVFAGTCGIRTYLHSGSDEPVEKAIYFQIVDEYQEGLKKIKSAATYINQVAQDINAELLKLQNYAKKDNPFVEDDERKLSFKYAARLKIYNTNLQHLAREFEKLKVDVSKESEIIKSRHGQAPAKLTVDQMLDM